MITLAPTSLTRSAEQAAAAVAAASGSKGAAAAVAATGTNALQALGSNFNQFLTLLTTQLKNQDPTSPTDTNQFTQELVQFTGVQQSVATNTNLTQLIQLQQGAEVLQSSQVVGHRASVTAGQIALQHGGGEIDFSTTAAEPVQIAVVDAAGHPIRDVSLVSSAGSNVWQWDGRDNAGNPLADGSYGVALQTGTSSADATMVPFSVVGTATGLTNTATGLQLQLGSLSVALSKVQSISAN